MVHPPKWEQHEALEMIIYFSDSSECGGSTAVLPREGKDDPGLFVCALLSEPLIYDALAFSTAYEWPYYNMPGVCQVPYTNDKRTAERKIKEFNPEIYRFRQALYDREKYVQFVPGTVCNTDLL